MMQQLPAEDIHHSRYSPFTTYTTALHVNCGSRIKSPSISRTLRDNPRRYPATVVLKQLCKLA